MSWYRAITMVGPPGAGKGTVGKRLAHHAGLVYLATGDIVRAETAKGGNLGETLKQFQQRGKLVPDTLMANMFFSHIASMMASGKYDRLEQCLLLDGMPRTDVQVAAMGEVGFEQVLYFDVSNEIVENRILKRAKEARDAGKQPRHDDTPEAIAARLAEYDATKGKLLNALSNRNAHLSRIDASGTIDDVFKASLDALRRQYR